MGGAQDEQGREKENTKRCVCIDREIDRKQSNIGEHKKMMNGEEGKIGNGKVGLHWTGISNQAKQKEWEKNTFKAVRDVMGFCFAAVLYFRSGVFPFLLYLALGGGKGGRVCSAFLFSAAP